MENSSQLAAEKVESFIDGFFWMLPNLGIALFVLGLFLVAAWIARASVTHFFRHRHRENLGEMLAGFARWGIILLGGLVAATIVFPSIKPADLLSTLGIGSIAIGFAFKDILQNWIAGLLILVRQPFHRGDQIEVGDHEGTVQHIEARATLIQTYDGQLVVIPNADIYTRTVKVRTAFPKRRSEYEVGISYSDDIATARRVILDALSRVEGVEREPAPDVLAWALDQSSVNLKVRWWTDSKRSTIVAVHSRVIEAVKHALDDVGITIPFPMRVVLFHDETNQKDPSRAAGDQDCLEHVRSRSSRFRTLARAPD